MGRSRMFWRLFGAYSSLLLISLSLMGWILLRRFEQRLIDNAQSAVESEAQWAALALETVKTDLSLRQLLPELACSPNTRIIVVDESLRVVADSGSEFEAGRDLDHYPELADANLVNEVVFQRRDPISGAPSIHAARRIGPWIMLLSKPFGTISTELSGFRKAIILTGCAALLLSLLISYFLALWITAPLTVIAETARSESAGTGALNGLPPPSDELGTLEAALSGIEVALTVEAAHQDGDRQKLRAVLRNILEGVLVLDDDQSIQFCNDSARQLLDLPRSDWRGRKLWQYARNYQLTEVVEQIASADGPRSGVVECGGRDPKVLSVHGTRFARASDHQPGTTNGRIILVVHDITDIRRLERIRQEFVANVSHELKTPLAAIQATVETLIDGAISEKEPSMRFLRGIRENSDRLHRLVQDLLSLGRIESGQASLDIQPVQIAEVLQDCIANLQPRLTAKKLQMILQPPPLPIQLLSDEDALGEIFTNLLDNAVKYTPQGGRITARWVLDGTDVIVEVSDTGVGIPERDMPRIFERFYRADKARSRALGGTGLGLSIVKHLAQNLGGTVTAQSTVGKGSSFVVSFPAQLNRESISAIE